MNKVPEIRISFSYLLYLMECQALAEKYDQELKSMDYYYDQTVKYWEEWQKQGEKILKTMEDILGVKFYLPVIDVTLAPLFIPKSAPLTLNFGGDPDEFVDNLTHELCHVILNDNNRYQTYNAEPESDIGAVWRKQYDTEDRTALSHIPVNAMLKYIWCDVLKESHRYEREKAKVKKYKRTGKSYEAAWKYVDEHDYSQILADLKKFYQEIKT